MERGRRMDAVEWRGGESAAALRGGGAALGGGGGGGPRGAGGGGGGPPLVPEGGAGAGGGGRAAAPRAGGGGEVFWLPDPPPLYTAGTSARDEDLVEPGLLPVHRTGRGGQFTYHGPGQRVGYAMLDLKRRGADIRGYVGRLEEWVIRALA